MQALVSEVLRFHCSVLKAQVSASLLREGEVEKRDEGSFLCILSFSKESMRL